jgi:hypothetical protein
MMCSYRATETGSKCEGEKTVVLTAQGIEE